MHLKKTSDTVTRWSKSGCVRRLRRQRAVYGSVVGETLSTSQRTIFERLLVEKPSSMLYFSTKIFTRPFMCHRSLSVLRGTILLAEYALETRNSLGIQECEIPGYMAQIDELLLYHEIGGYKSALDACVLPQGGFIIQPVLDYFRKDPLMQSFVKTYKYVMSDPHVAWSVAIILGLYMGTILLRWLIPRGFLRNFAINVMWLHLFKEVLTIVGLTFLDQDKGAMDEFTSSIASYLTTQASSLHAVGEIIVPQGLPSVAFSALIMAYFSKKIPFYRVFVDSPKLHHAVECVLGGSLKTIEDVVNLILPAFGYDAMHFAGVGSRAVREWGKAAVEFRIMYTTSGVPGTDVQARMTFRSLMNNGRNLLVQSKDPKEREYIDRVIRDLDKFSSNFPSITGGVRMEPVVVALRGDPGVGKTTIMRYLVEYIASKHVSEEMRNSFGGNSGCVYQKGTSEYWEMYAGQPILAIDDFGQAKSVPGSGENEISMFIRAVNQWPFPLNMAFENKGKILFNSEFILLTTNLHNGHYLGSLVNSPGAVVRRMELPFEVRLTGLMSPSEVCSFADACKCWSFRRYCFTEGRTVGQDMSLGDVFDSITSVYEKKIQVAKQLDAGTSVVVDEFLREKSRNASSEHVVVSQSGLIVPLAASVVIVVAVCVLAVFMQTYSKVNTGFCTIRRIAEIGAMFLAFVVVLAAMKKIFFMIFPKGPKHVVSQAALGDEVALAFSRNIREIYSDPPNPNKIGHITFVDERLGLVPRHFFRVDSRYRLYIHSLEGSGGRIYLDECSKTIVDEKRDCYLVSFPVKVQGIRSLRRHIRPRTDKTFPGHVVFVTDRGGMKGFNTNQPLQVRYANDAYTGASSVIPYKIPSRIGDCGASVLVANHSNLRRFLGIHVAGDNSDTGYFCPIFTDDLPKEVVSQGGSITLGRKVDPVFNSGDSKFVETGYSGALAKSRLYKPCLRPAHNVEGVLIDPMVKAIADTDVDFSAEPKVEFIDESCKFVMQRVFKSIDTESLRILDDAEVVKGFDHPYGRGINRGTSPGYPLCLKHTNKRTIFGETDWVLDTVEAKGAIGSMHDLESAYLRGSRPDVIWRDALKDEPLPLRKVSAVTTRLLATCPLDYLLLSRKHYLPFVAEFMRTRMMHGCMIGVNPYSREWERLHSHLSRFGTRIYDGDFKQFDKRQHPLILKSLLHHLNRAITSDPDRLRIMDGIAREVYDSLHLGGNAFRSDTLYNKVGSLPSGHPMTSIINSLYNMFLFVNAWMSKYGLGSLVDFERELSLFVYGDDNTFSVSPKYASFSFEYLEQHFALFGMTYTDSAKGDLTVEHRLSFLKRGYDFHEGYCYASLELDSIYEMLNWRRKSTSDEEHLRAVLPTVFMEVSAHSLNVFCETVERVYARFGSVCDDICGFRVRNDLGFSYMIFQERFQGYTPIWSSEGNDVCYDSPSDEAVTAVGVGDINGHDRRFKIYSQSGIFYKHATHMDNTEKYNNKTNLIGTGTLDPAGAPQDDGHTRLVAVPHDMAYLTTTDNSHDLQVYRPPARVFDRPVVLASGTIPNGTVGSFFEYSFDENNVLLSENINNAAGFVGIRFCMKFTLIISAPPQSLGIVKLALYPIEDIDQIGGLAKGNYAPLWSQTPNAELNLADCTAVELCYDYNFYRQYLRLGTASPDAYLRLILGSYTPVAAPVTATTPVSYTLYVSYADVELISPGSGLVTVIAQSGMEFKAVGPVSTVMQYTAKIANGISDRIPVLTKYLNPVSWIASGIGSLAAQFGYSRPNRAASKLIQHTIGRTYNTALTVTNAAEFGMIDNNQVAVIDDIGFNKIDEMTFDFLTSVPGCIYRGNLSTSDVAGSYKWSCNVSFDHFVFQQQGSATSYTQLQAASLTSAFVNAAVLPTPLFMLSTCMRYWRGDLTFRFKFARSKFMGGRVLLGYNPKPDSLVGEVVASTVRYEYPSIIVDLREGSVFDLEVPYNHPNEMLDTTPTIQTQNNGTVFMRVLDPLLVASDVTPTCYFVVEVFSKKGIMFGGPQRSPFGYSPSDTTVLAQSGLSTFERVIGEPVLSVKQLICRPTWNEVPPAAAASTSFVPLAKAIPLTFNTSGTTSIMEFYVSDLWNGSANISGTESYLNLFMPVFRFWRGSYIFNYLPSNNEVINLVGGAPTDSTQGMPILREYATLASIRQPFYSPYPKAPLSVASGPSQTLTLLSSNATPTGYYSLVPGDDFQLGAFTGFGPVSKYQSPLVSTFMW